MPALNLDQQILTAEADANIDTGGHAGVRTALDFQGQAEIKRGLRIDLRVSAAAELKALWEQYIAAGVELEARAEAGISLQAQQPINLFREFGAAVQVKAYAKAGVAARLHIGLSIGDFIALAKNTENIPGAFERLLIIFLEELDISAGCRIEAAYSAMLMARLAVTGSFAGDANQKKGFSIQGKFACGLEAGMSLEWFANFGITDPRRWYRRSVDVMVDEALGYLQELGVLPEAAVSLLPSLQAPLKIGFRSAYEVGLVIADNPGLFTNLQPRLINSCLQVVMEELQQAVLRAFVDQAFEMMRGYFMQFGVADLLQHSDQELAELKAHLQEMPSDPFDPANNEYWQELLDAVVAVMKAVVSAAVPDEVKLAVAQLYASVSLISHIWSKTSRVEFSASFLGLTELHSAIPLSPFTDEVIDKFNPDESIRQVIRTSLELPSNASLTTANLIEFLLNQNLPLLLQTQPHLRPVLEIIAGPDGDNTALAAALETILTHAGSFVQNNGKFDAKETLNVIIEGLSSYIQTRVDQELIPLINEVLQDDPLATLYFHEVLRPTLDFSIATLFTEVVKWSSTGAAFGDALSEACTGIIMKLVSRSLVVAADIITDRVLTDAGEAIRSIDGDALAVQTANVFHINHGIAAMVIQPTLRATANAVRPFSPAQRERIRASLYTLLDPYALVNGNPIDHFMSDLFGFDTLDGLALRDLADVVGSHFIAYLKRFINESLEAAAEEFSRYILDSYQEWLDDTIQWFETLRKEQANFDKWIGELEDSLSNLSGIITAARANITEAFILATQLIEGTLSPTELLQTLVDQAFASIIATPAYKLLPSTITSPLINSLKSTLKGTIRTTILHPVREAAESAAFGNLVNNMCDTVAEHCRSHGTASAQALVQDELTSLLTTLVTSAFPHSVSVSGSVPLSYFVWSYTPVKGIYRQKKTVNLPYHVTMSAGQLREALLGDIRTSGVIEDFLSRLSAPLNAFLEAINKQITQLGMLGQFITEREHHTALLNVRPGPNARIEIAVPGTIQEHEVAVTLDFFDIPSAIHMPAESGSERIRISINDIVLDTATLFRFSEIELPDPLPASIPTHAGSLLYSSPPALSNVPGSLLPLSAEEHPVARIWRLSTVLTREMLQPGINILTVILPDGTRPTIQAQKGFFWKDNGQIRWRQIESDRTIRKRGYKP